MFRLDLDYYKDGTVDYLVSYLVSICNVVVVVIIISLLRMGFLEVIGIIGCSTVQHWSLNNSWICKHWILLSVQRFSEIRDLRLSGHCLGIKSAKEVPESLTISVQVPSQLDKVSVSWTHGVIRLSRPPTPQNFRSPQANIAPLSTTKSWWNIMFLSSKLSWEWISMGQRMK